MEPLAVVTRGKYVESVHYGFICVAGSSGQVLYSLGDYNTKIYFRSSAKPIQVIPLIESGAADSLGFSLKDIAIACASHSGQRIHQETVCELLKKLNLKETNLHCGIAAPYNEDEKRRLAAQGLSPSVFHCSCSGKHSAMLALAKFRGYSIDDYEKISSPVQQEILKTIAKFAGESSDSIATCTDGCGVPVYLLPIYKIALSYARLVMYGQCEQSPYHNSCRAVFNAMTQYPEIVAGDYEFCTELMRATKDKLIAKAGSEAVYCLGIRDKNIGICIKIADGNERAIYPVVIHTLRELGILDDIEFSKLKHWYNIILKNNRDEHIGDIIPIFNLNSSKAGLNPLGQKYKDL